MRAVLPPAPSGHRGLARAVAATPAALLAVVLLATSGLAKDAPKAPAKPAAKAASGPEARAEAIVRAIRRLDEDVATTERDMNEQHRIFTLSIAALDFLLDASGGKGIVHADRLDRALDAIGRYVDGAEQAFGAKSTGAPDEMRAFEWSQTTWALGAAGVVYAELAARGQKKAEASRRLRTIVDLLGKSQQPDGGFGHDREGRPRIPEIPLPGGGTMKYPATLLSASNWACFAVGLARGAAGKKAEPIVAKAKAYYAASMSGDGTYPYDPSQKGSGGGDVTAAARTAGSYCALRALGVPARDRALARSASYLERSVESLPEGHGSSPHGVFFGAIATLWMGGKPRATFEASIWPRILAAQDDATGALDCICRHDFATTCESFKNGENLALKMGGGGGGWDTWVRAYVNALNLFALLAEKGKLKLLDGVPADPARTTTPAPATTPDAAPETTTGDGGDTPPPAPAAPAPPTPERPAVK